MSKAAKKPLTIFQTGRHTDKNNRTSDFAEGTVRASADAYDPKLHEAPLVIGHPKEDAPAYGWVHSLDYEESTGELQAAHRDVDAAFSEWVNKGAWKKISSSFYPPQHPRNPVPGVYYLRHVGFFGAQPPSIKGMPDASFSEDGDGCVTIEFGEADLDGTADFGGLGMIGRGIARALRGLREYVIEKDGRDAADSVVPQYLTESDYYDPPESEAAYSEPANHNQETTVPPKKPNQQQPPNGGGDNGGGEADFAERESAIQKREQALAAKERNLQRQEITDFVEGLVCGPDKKGKITPKMKAPLIEYLTNADAAFAEAEITEIEFSEGDGSNPVKKKPSDLIRGVLEGLPDIVDYSEAAGSDKTMPDEFSEVEREAHALAGVDYKPAAS